MGKTTIASLILRFYRPSCGRLRIGGLEASEIPIQDLRQHVTYIPQDLFLFDDSIGYNLRYGRLNASDIAVHRAIKAACIDDFVSSLSAGLDTRISGRGANLSQGQKQRLCIARGLVRDCGVLILDEVTSGIDPRTEVELLERLHEILAGKTVLVITHRLSTLKGVDRILVMDGGRIVEEGSHEALQATGGRYCALFGLGQEKSAVAM